MSAEPAVPLQEPPTAPAEPAPAAAPPGPPAIVVSTGDPELDALSIPPGIISGEEIPEEFLKDVGLHIKDWERKRDKLNIRAEDHRAKRDRMNDNARSLLDQRDQVLGDVRRLVREAGEAKERRNSLNEKVRAAKTERETLNRGAAETADNANRLKRDRLPKDGVNVARLKRDLRELEFRQMTSVLGAAAERELIDQMTRLQAMIREREKSLTDNDDVRIAVEEARKAADLAEIAHKAVGELAQAAQQEHDTMVQLYEKSDEHRRELDRIHEEITKAKTTADEEHRLHIEHIRQVHDLDKLIQGARRRGRAVRLMKKDSMTKATADDVMERLRKGGKLSTEDLMALQTRD